MRTLWLALGLLLAAVPAHAQSFGLPLTATATAANSLIIPGHAYVSHVEVTTGATAGYLMAFDAIAAPADGTVAPLFCMGLAAATSLLARDFVIPVYFSFGMTLVFSSTGCFTKTASATAFIAAQSNH